MALTTALTGAECLKVPSNKILAGNLASVVPLFASVAGDVIIGAAPFPGTVRLLSSRDVYLAARQNGIAFSPGTTAPSVCVERALHPVAADDVRAALLAALDDPAPRIDLLDFSRQPLPDGSLSFSVSGLSQPPRGDPTSPVIWSGKLIYDGEQSLRVWAKVRVSVEKECFVTKTTIPRGTELNAEQLERVVAPQFPGGAAPLILSAIIGKSARRIIAAGERITPAVVENTHDVVQGDTVHVRVIEGAAEIRFDGVAQSSGMKGERILVHNPASGKTFSARIDDRDSVLVRPEASPR